MAADEVKYNDYEAFGPEYARNSETNPFNAYYERPAIISLAGDVRGLRVLDAGCGPGVHASELLKRGAAVTGVDASAALLAVARERLGPAVPLHRADLTEPLDFPDRAFDLVLSALVMHYIRDWEPTLREFRRVLAPGGRLVMSTHHPFMDMEESGSDDYFGTYQFTQDWRREGGTMHMRFWHRPLRDMIAAFLAAGFTVADIAEPSPQPELAELDPEDYRQLSRKATFLFFSLTRS